MDDSRISQPAARSSSFNPDSSNAKYARCLPENGILKIPPESRYWPYFAKLDAESRFQFVIKSKPHGARTEANCRKAATLSETVRRWWKLATANTASKGAPVRTFGWFATSRMSARANVRLGKFFEATFTSTFEESAQTYRKSEKWASSCSSSLPDPQPTSRIFGLGFRFFKYSQKRSISCQPMPLRVLAKASPKAS